MFFLEVDDVEAIPSCTIHTFNHGKKRSRTYGA